MKGQHLAEAIGEMDDRYYQEAETCCPGRRREKRLARGAAGIPSGQTQGLPFPRQKLTFSIGMV